MREHLRNLLGTHPTRVVKEQVEEELRGEKDVRERTMEVVVNLSLRKIRSRGEEKEEVVMKVKDGKEAGDTGRDRMKEGKIASDRAKKILKGVYCPSYCAHAQDIYTDRIRRHV